MRASAGTGDVSWMLLGVALLLQTACSGVPAAAVVPRAGSAEISAADSVRILKIDGVEAQHSLHDVLWGYRGYPANVDIPAGHHIILVVYDLRGSESRTEIQLDTREGWTYTVRGAVNGYRARFWVEESLLNQI